MNSTTAPLWCKVPKFEISKDAKIDIPAYGGRMDVRWDPGTKVTASGGLAYFALFLKTTGLFESLCSDFPVDYRSNNSCSKRDIVGTMVLAILFGKDRYVQINALRNDTAAMELLGLGRIVSEDTVRRSLRKADGKALDDWLSRHEHEAVDAMLRFGYIIDIDNTVKPIFGHQEGAELGYNPQKPGRPSHNYHTFFIGSARITLGVDVLPGRQHAGACGMARLWSFLDAISPDLWPFLLRGDVGYGNDGIMSEAEARGLTYLFKIKRTGLAKELFTYLADDNKWKDCGCGWESHEHHLKLSSWKLARRLVFIRRPMVKGHPGIPLEQESLPSPEGAKAEKAPRQQVFEFAKDKHGREWDYCILVTNDTSMDATALSQLYRDRGDCENNFDEFKNQWGWAGFTTKAIKSCKAMARLIAIVSNWWNVFTRLADPEAHREPVTSRPAYLNVIGRIVKSGGRRTIHLTSTHADADAIRNSLNLIGQFLGWVDSIAEQLKPDGRWTLILTVAFRKLLRLNPRRGPNPTLIPA
jgi:hypothetical protein